MPAAIAGRLIVFARVPRLGEVKTRLAAVIGASQALAVYERLLDAALTTVVQFAAAHPAIELELCVAGDDVDCALADRARRAAMRLSAQSAGDLGQRMRAALNRSLDDGLPGVLIGTDCPALQPHHLHWAFASLLEADAAFLPVEDGGYVLVGLSGRADALFDGVAWSTDQVMAQTRRRLSAAGMSWHEGERLWDIDEAADLRRWSGGAAS